MASGSVKGITIEIEGKTSGLVKSLGDVNKALNQTQKNLQTVNKALKLDPKNLDTLKQKQNLLNDAIKQTEEKLKLEKKAAEDAAKALEEGTITKGQYDTLQAEVAKTSSELNHLQGEAQKTDAAIKELGGNNKLGSFESALQKAGDKLKEVGNGIAEIGETLTKTVTVAIAGLGVAAYKTANDVDDAMDTIAIKTGAVGKELEGMEDIAKDIATEIPTDFETAAEAVGEVSTRFGVNGQRLQELSTKYVKFAQLNRTDVTSAVDSTQKALAAFGKGANEADTLLDYMNQTAQQTGVNISTLSSGLVSNSAAFQEMGMSMRQSVAFMGKLEKSGADSTTVMSGLRKAMKNATKDGKPLNEALKDLEESIKNGTGEMDGLTYAYDLFGRSGDQVYQAVKNGSLSFQDMAGKAGDLTSAIGNVDKTYASLEDGSGELKVAQNNLKDALSEVGQTLGETLAPAIKTVSEWLKKFSDWWKSLSPTMQKVILIVTGLVAVLGPLLIFIGKIAAGVGALITVFTGASAALGGLSVSLGAILAPIAAVVAAVVAVIEVIKHWDEIMEVLGFVWEKICEGIKTAFQAVWDFFVEGFTAIGELASEVCTAIGDFFSGLWDSICNIFSGIGEWFSGVFQAAYDGVVGIWEGIKEFFTGVWDSIVNTFHDIGVAIYDAITGVVKGAINAVLSGAVGIINGFVAAINGVIWVINLIPGVDISELDYLDVPQLARGGILQKGEVGLLEGNGAEAVVPLDQNKAWIDAVAKQMQISQSAYTQSTDYSNILEQIVSLMKSGSEVNVALNVDGQQFDRAVVKGLNRYNYRQGGH